MPQCRSDDKIQYLLRAEEQILQPISTRAPLAEVLNEICGALDCQIGNVVSLISLRDDDATNLAEIARNAALFGLHMFFSAGVVAESDEEIGSLEIYCSVPRSPSASELQLIERAKCLAAIAIKLDNASLPFSFSPCSLIKSTKTVSEMLARRAQTRPELGRGILR